MPGYLLRFHLSPSFFSLPFQFLSLSVSRWDPLLPVSQGSFVFLFSVALSRPWIGGSNEYFKSSPSIFANRPRCFLLLTSTTLHPVHPRHMRATLARPTLIQHLLAQWLLLLPASTTPMLPSLPWRPHPRAFAEGHRLDISPHLVTSKENPGIGLAAPLPNSLSLSFLPAQ